MTSVEDLPLQPHIGVMESWWGALYARVMGGLATAGIIGLFSLAWWGMLTLQDIRLDVATMKATTVGDLVRISSDIARIQTWQDEVRARLRELERNSGSGG